MKYQKLFLIVVFVFLFNLVAACSPATVSAPAETATATLVPSTPTKTPKPTSTPKPSATPNVIETQNYDDIFSDVQKYKDEGLIPATNGKYSVLDDFSETIAERGSLYYWYYDFKVKHFVYKAHVEWSTADDTNETSGCGIVFAVEPRGKGNEYYGVFIYKSLS